MAKKKKKKSQSEHVLSPDQDVWRGEKGLYKRGNPGGPGRPFIRQQRFMVLINEAVDEKSWLSIIKKAVSDAKSGDRHAREWLSKWLLGLPEAVRDEKQTILEVISDGSFVEWIESGRHNGGAGAG